MTARRLKIFFLLSAGGLLLLLPALFSAPASLATDDVLERTRAVYASLNSYSDTGVVVNEFGVSSKEQHTFTTYFNRAPRRFYFDFNKAGGDRFVIFGDPDAFHTWWKAISSTTDYPNPNNIGAFVTANPNTLGTAVKIPTLLYAKAAMQGAFTNYKDAVMDDTEDVNGHKCYRLVGTAKDVYGATGHETNIRKMTVWIDVESSLIRKVVELPKEQLPGQLNRTTTTFEPQANPALDESCFSFTPP